MLTKFRFKKGNRFELLLYVQSNSYGTKTETWTEIEGRVEFSKGTKGQQIFITKAEKGTCRTSINGKVRTKSVCQRELNTQYSNRYLWERISFTGDSRRAYLLVIDLDEHPEADVNFPGSIDPSWVSKFYIPTKNKTKSF